jgi:DNA-binding GntR family transcriptional regulator
MSRLSSRRAGQVASIQRTIVEIVAAELRQQIIDGTLPSGAPLRHEQIAAELGVSHNPVREAILSLDQEGWVRHESHRGARVVGLTAVDVVDDYELRGIVVGLIARRAVEYASAKTIADFESLVGVMRSARGLDAFENANASFLEHLQAVADSARLNAALLVTPPIVPSRFDEAARSVRRWQQQGASRFVEALIARDASAADAALSDSLAGLGVTVARLIGARPADAGASGPARNRRSSRPWAETSAYAVASHVRRLIFDGELQAGQRLPQDEIAAAMGVSRIPVRQAIITLEREGWIRTEPHRGSYINPFDARAIRDRFSLYGRFYAFATRRALTRIGPDDLERLTAIASELVASSNAAEIDKASVEYLGTIIRIAGSQRLRAVLRSTAQIVPGNFYEAVPAAIRSQQRGIARLQTAIKRGDARDAVDACIALQERHAREVVAVRHRRRQDRTGRWSGDEAAESDVT